MEKWLKASLIKVSYMGLDRRYGLVVTNTKAIGYMDFVQAQVDTLGKTVTCIMESLKIQR